jgi:hypothetical protein
MSQGLNAGLSFITNMQRMRGQRRMNDDRLEQSQSQHEDRMGLQERQMEANIGQNNVANHNKSIDQFQQDQVIAQNQQKLDADKDAVALVAEQKASAESVAASGAFFHTELSHLVIQDENGNNDYASSAENPAALAKMSDYVSRLETGLKTRNANGDMVDLDISSIQRLPNGNFTFNTPSGTGEGTGVITANGTTDNADPVITLTPDQFNVSMRSARARMLNAGSEDNVVVRKKLLNDMLSLPNEPAPLVTLSNMKRDVVLTGQRDALMEAAKTLYGGDEGMMRQFMQATQTDDLDALMALAATEVNGQPIMAKDKFDQITEELENDPLWNDSAKDVMGSVPSQGKAKTEFTQTQQAQADETLGEKAYKVLGEAADWAIENPYEAIGLGLIFVPGVGWAASAASKAAMAGVRGLSKPAVRLKMKSLAQKLYTKKGAPVNKGIPKAGTNSLKTSLEKTRGAAMDKKFPGSNRQFSKNRASDRKSVV